LLLSVETETCDFLIIGGGIIGFTMAYQLTEKFPKSKIIVLEKEEYCGAHASGRNSGVIHAGFYYSEDSLKAKFTRSGNIALTRFCEEHEVKINRCGKLVVATNEKELKTLELLFSRAVKNQVPVERVDAKQAKAIEPKVKVYGDLALWSPTTSVVNPVDVLNKLKELLEQKGVSIRFGESFQDFSSQNVRSTRKQYAPEFVINCAGLYADKVAMKFGFSKKYRILPFKGLYLYGEARFGKLRTNIYPVPDLDYPFLGVHFTVTTSEKVKIGPTAIPALWRENYGGMANFKFSEFIDILSRQTSLFFNSNMNFRKLALTEIKKFSSNTLEKLAASLVEDIQPGQFKVWGKPGIRAQLINTETKKLEMDFLYEGDERSLHVLNAVSPAFTGSFPMAEFLVRQLSLMKM